MAKSIDEIAKLAGVSVTSVRLVINGQDKKYRISEKTRARIQSIIDEHGYYINQTARSLKLQKTQTLGLVVPRLTNPFFSQLTEALEIRCRECGYQLITVCSRDEAELEKQVVENLIYRSVDGLFVTSSYRERQSELMENNHGKPVVFLDRDFGTPDIAVVSTNNLDGAKLLGRKMARQLEGRNLTFMGADDWLPTIQDRLEGLKAGLKEEGYSLLDKNVLYAGRISRSHGYQKMAELYKSLGRAPEALVTSALPVLEGCLEYLKKEHGGIPHDMLIGSFDDHAMLGFLPNKVFSVRQNATELALEAYRILEAKILKEELEQQKRVIMPDLITY
ncbi:substrate-binding domain-containing protein [Endozoicomonas arenosclerae]|uniref:LacI family DNA-binding transcriptional regulator n=1 Tax=Endozoicomonas arenosclerae TaxID=1633495 RepID=UPI0007849848|nr:substrate-binding domain-containing protein [Endozoicomonas arenosclerae]